MFALETAKLAKDVSPEEAIARDPELEARLQRLAVEHYDFVWRSLRRLGVAPPETDDAAQRVFLVIADKLPNIEPSKERSFVFGIVMRVAANVRRDRATARQREAEDTETSDLPIDAPTAEAEVARAQARVRLDAILASMSEDRRAVFVLFELEELTVTEIAELLGLPLGTVGSRLRRAREDFRTAVARLHARDSGV
ncbi:RNA polymerase sigma factor RpoE [Labilithrix luteola]|uniref:RNA polymerase sigma factor RpoE n=1 Tax=Labilithrix luteola TaxID=1391654 RepID=A0A0K1Q140_9BACT|nr:sigma-70 family RNA polymerase sigma factor [Labilithrix luteola]AKU99500.1 RNA polymerase sigma factor RpoE [Labilithrix luteola]